MEELSRIKARLESLSELGELVGALRSMAASRAREAQEAFAGTRAYSEFVERAIAEVDLLLPEGSGTVLNDGAAGKVLLVIASENGFVGLFNGKLIEHALEIRQKDEELVIVGRRGQITASEHGLTEAACFPMTSRVQGVTALARRIAARISGAAAVRIVFAQHRPGAVFDVVTKPVLPFGEMSVRPGRVSPVVHIPPKVLLSRLAGEYLFAEIAHALMESLASENGARMRAMDSASRNIGDRVEDLRRNEHIARQEKTTTEMLDVVTGAEAVAQG